MSGANAAVAANTRRPEPRLSNELLGTLYFLGAEAMFFLGLIFVATALHHRKEVWPPPDSPPLELGLLAVNTTILLASGATALVARRAAGRADGAALVRWLGATIALGTAFVAGQVAAFARLGGWRPTESLYRTLFDVIAGFHALHVVAGLVVLLVVLWRARLGQFGPGRDLAVTAAAWYWYFVTAVWLALLATLVHVS